MVRKIVNGSALIEKWLRNKNTIEFLGILAYGKKCIMQTSMLPLMKKSCWRQD